MTDKVLVEINKLYSAQKMKFFIKDFFITIPPENCDRVGKRTLPIFCTVKSYKIIQAIFHVLKR